MNRNTDDPRHPWMRLNSAARTVRDTRDTSAPYGFATRLASLALGSERRMVSLLERLSLRALYVACLLAVASVAVNYQTLLSGGSVGLDEFETTPVRDAVTVVLDLAD